MLWLTVSKALGRSKNIPEVDSFLSIAEDMLLIKSVKARAVEWLLRNPRIVSSIRYYASSRIPSVGWTCLSQKV